MKIRFRNGIHPLLKILIGLAIFCGVIGAAIFTYAYVYFSRIIDRRLNGAIFANTSRIYASPTPVFVGEPMKSGEIAGTLRRAGYSETKTNRVGWYQLVPGGIEIFPGPDSYFQAEAGLIKVAGGKVERIVSLGDNTDRQRYDLEPEIITNLYDRAREKRRLVRYDDLPANLVNAVLAIEDRNFFQHSGVDFLRVGKAAYDDIRGRRIKEGASTLSMQLAGLFFLNRNEKTWKRKLSETVITLELEQRLSKKEIFEDYMNQVNFGQRGSFSINGVGEASLAYFDKDVRQLTLPESALLAAMVNGPSYYSPYRQPERARQRRNLVLDSMVTIGAITPDQREAASRAPLGVVPAATDTGDAPYFVDLVKDALLEKYSEKDLTTSSFKIYTGLDLDLQKIASEAIQEGIKEADGKLAPLRKRHPKLPEAQVALVCLDPHTGEVLALQGGRSYGASQLNRAIANRQPGSSFKPFVYAAAFNSAVDGSKPLMTPSTIVVDEPTVFSFPNGAKTTTYEPDNFHEEWGGPITLRHALEKSANVATIKVAEKIGYDKVVKLAHAAGLKTAQPTPAMAIGSYETTPLEMAGAYTTFANGGEFLEPMLVHEVKSADNTVLEEHVPQPKKILDPRVAYLMTNLLEGNMDHGTAAASRSTYGFRAPAAGKTGSSHDAWFAGYTSNLLLIVWVGFDDNTNMPLTGAQAALPIWVNFMKKAIALRRYRDTMPFEPPTGVVHVEIDADTGMLATSWCPNRKWETYIDGGQPELCTAHDKARASRTGFFSALFGVRGAVPPPPASPGSAGSSPPGSAALAQSSGSAGAAAAAEAPASQGADAKKKRGFFSRLFGVGGKPAPKDSSSPDSTQNPAKPKDPHPNQ
jgi:penicillin-binding protein 1B